MPITRVARTLGLDPNSTEIPLAKPNYQQQKKQRELAKKKKNEEKRARKGRGPQPLQPEQPT